MSRAFNPRADYQGDYRFVPGILRAKRTRPGVTGYQVFWVKEIGLNHPAYSTNVEALSVSGTDEIYQAWKERITDDDLQPGDVLDITDTPKPALKVVRRAALASYNQWNISTQEATRDG